MRDQKPKLCCPGGALPYHMGNAGDLLKHGVLAEFVRWRCESLSAKKPFRFLDPFGGLPFCGAGGSWCGAENPAIERFSRFAELAPDCALVQAQKEMPRRYYGSGRVVRAIAGENAKVFFSDRCPEKRRILSHEGFTELEARGFDPRDGYSVLNSINQGHICADLVLIDPFGDFLQCRQDDVLPRIAEASKRTAIVLFALDMNTGKSKSRTVERISEKWRENKEKHLAGALTLSCPPLGSYDGKKYKVEVVLSGPNVSAADGLRAQLSDFAEKLADVLGLFGENAEMLKPKVIGRKG